MEKKYHFFIESKVGLVDGSMECTFDGKEDDVILLQLASQFLSEKDKDWMNVVKGKYDGMIQDKDTFNFLSYQGGVMTYVPSGRLPEFVRQFGKIVYSSNTNRKGDNNDIL